MHPRIRHRRQALGHVMVASDIDAVTAELLDLLQGLETKFVGINLAVSDPRLAPLQQCLFHARDVIERALQGDLTAVDLLPSANATLVDLGGTVRLMRDELRARVSG